MHKPWICDQPPRVCTLTVLPDSHDPAPLVEIAVHGDPTFAATLAQALRAWDLAWLPARQCWYTLVAHLALVQQLALAAACERVYLIDGASIIELRTGCHIECGLA